MSSIVSRPALVRTLPDFRNSQTSPDEWYDRYQGKGMAELMPYAKAASAKEDTL